MQADYIIVGQGLAGTTLAWHLLEAGAKVTVIDQAKKHTSSWAAAGLYNPVTGRKMVKTWMADELFPYLQTFYRRIEKVTESSFMHPKPIYRPFLSREEQNDWMVQGNNNVYASFVEKVEAKSKYPNKVNDSYGGLLLKQCGYLNVSGYLDASREYFKNKGIYQQFQFDHNQLLPKKDYAELKDQRVQKVIFCEGPDADNNPFFGWLPFSLVKGEILLIRPEEPHHMVYNRGIFVLPTGNVSKVGSTYHHHDLSYQPTLNGRRLLEEKLQKLCKFHYEVVDHIAGVRPATKDRKPFVGIHPAHKPLAVFNGLGTKGVSLAPFFARQFVASLTGDKSLEEAVNIQRFYHLYNSVLT